MVGCCCKLSIEYVTWLQYLVMRTYPIVVHKLFNGIIICRLCSFEESHGTFPLYPFLLSTVVTCCTEFYLYFFIWKLGVVVLISFTPTPSVLLSADYQMFGNHVLIHTYIELLAWFLEYSQLARRKSMLAMWEMHMLKIYGKWQVDTGHCHQSSTP